MSTLRMTVSETSYELHAGAGGPAVNCVRVTCCAYCGEPVEYIIDWNDRRLETWWAHSFDMTPACEEEA